MEGGSIESKSSSIEAQVLSDTSSVFFWDLFDQVDKLVFAAKV
jgi:hypothetical protein